MTIKCKHLSPPAVDMVDDTDSMAVNWQSHIITGLFG